MEVKMRDSINIHENEVLYFKNLFEYSPEAMVLIDKSGKIKMVNKEFVKLFGYSKEELIGKSIDDMIVDKEHFGEAHTLNSKAMIGEKVEIETIRVTKSGRKIPVSTLGIKFKEPSGEEMIFATYRDISERINSERKNVIQQRVIKVINKILRHDLMNYFAVLKSAFRLYADSKDEELLNEALKHINKGITLIRSMKSFEQFSVAEGNFHQIDALKEIKEVTTLFPNMDFDITGNCIINADKAFSRIIENLINNAIKHGEATKISIELTDENDKSIIRISDNGKGIEEKIKKNIFEEGFSYGKSGNTGLGLYIVKNLMEIYNGSVEIEDNKPHGSTFILKFY